MAAKQGRFDEHLRVDSPTTIQGAVIAGATVEKGASLLVQGALAGPLKIEDGATVSVHGTLSCDIHNEGVLSVSGVVTEPLPTTGLVLVSPGTLFTTGPRPSVLRDDGSLLTIWEDHVDHVNIDASVDKLLQLLPDGSFTQIARAKS